jgi:hypothetical protein
MAPIVSVIRDSPNFILVVLPSRNIQINRLRRKDRTIPKHLALLISANPTLGDNSHSSDFRLSPVTVLPTLEIRRRLMDHRDRLTTHSDGERTTIMTTVAQPAVPDGVLGLSIPGVIDPDREPTASSGCPRSAASVRPEFE